MTAPKKIVLAYSGGLDTSVILPWLKERYPGVKLVAFAAELGQGDELKGIEDKAYKSGADEVVVMDLRQEFAEKYCLPMLRAHAIYEQDYLLGTSIARPLIAQAGEGRAPDRRRRRRPRRHRQGQRPGPLRADVHGARPDAEDHRAVEGPAVLSCATARPRSTTPQKHKHPDPREQEEDLQPGPQPLAHLPRRRRDRAPGRTSRTGSVPDDDRAAGEGAEQGGDRRGRVRGGNPSRSTARDTAARPRDHRGAEQDRRQARRRRQVRSPRTASSA